jgi:hypothetical protein
LKQLSLALLILLLISCEETKKEEIKFEKKTLSQKQIDSIEKYKTLAIYDTFPKINYQKIVLEDWRHLLRIFKQYNTSLTQKQIEKIFMTLNRKEMRFFHKGDTIVIPDSLVSDIKAYSILPQFYWEAKELPKIIIVSNKYQVYGCYEFGKLVKFAACNTGKERTPTFPGRYALVWKKLMHRSSLDSNWKMPYTWNFHQEAGNAFHQFSMPGRPVSHSCVRQFMDDAEWLYYWGKGIKFDSTGKKIPMSGTPVIFIDIFDFSRDKYGPWLELASNKDNLLELPEKPMEVEEALIPWVQIPKESRGSLRNRERYVHAEDTLRARGIIRPHIKLTPSINFNELRRKKSALQAKLKLEKELKEKTNKETMESNPINNAPEQIY